MVATCERGNSVWFQAFAFICLDRSVSIISGGKDTEIDPNSIKAVPIVILKVMHVQCFLMN